MSTTDDVLTWRGRELRDRDGQKVGKIDEIYLDADTNQPEWALVNTGLFGSKSTFVPIRDASTEGEEVRVPFEKSQIKDAPGIDPDGRLSQDEEAELYRHYGLDYSEAGSESGLPEGGAGTAGSGGAGTTATGDTGTSGFGAAGTGDAERTATSGSGGRPGDDAMTRSEEEVRVGTTQRERGRARLRKYVETEDVQQTVPVSREEVRVEREPITDTNVDEATAGPEITESEHEVVLHEEEPVVEKRAVPKERIRLGTDTQTEEREVSEQVRKERVEVDDSGQADR